MMQDDGVLTAIDVGTTKVCTIIARKTGARGLKVLAHSVVPCDGLKKGNVTDVPATTKAIRASVSQAADKAGVSVQSGFVGVTGAHVSFENRKDPMGWVGERGVITTEDLARIPATVASSEVEAGRKIIHVIPMSYSLDGKDGIRNPLGMHTRHLEVETHVVTVASSFLDKLVEAVERAGVRVEGLVLEPLASSEAVLTAQEREEGAVLIDIGGGTTDIVVFKSGRVCYTTVLPVAGYQFTNDICMTYNTSYQAAEAAKLEYAHTEPYVVRPYEEVSLPVLDGEAELRVPRRDICQLTRERAQELSRLIRMKLQEAQIGDIGKAPFVLTGGTSNLPGLQALVQRTLTNRVRIGVPDGNGSIPDELKSPAYATGVGILMWATTHHTLDATLATNGSSPSDNGTRSGLVSRFFRQIRNLLPMRILAVKQGRNQ